MQTSLKARAQSEGFCIFHVHGGWGDNSPHMSVREVLVGRIARKLHALICMHLDASKPSKMAPCIGDRDTIAGTYTFVIKEEPLADYTYHSFAFCIWQLVVLLKGHPELHC